MGDVFFRVPFPRTVQVVVEFEVTVLGGDDPTAFCLCHIVSPSKAARISTACLLPKAQESKATRRGLGPPAGSPRMMRCGTSTTSGLPGSIPRAVKMGISTRPKASKFCGVLRCPSPGVPTGHRRARRALLLARRSLSQLVRVGRSGSRAEFSRHPRRNPENAARGWWSRISWPIFLKSALGSKARSYRDATCATTVARCPSPRTTSSFRGSASTPGRPAQAPRLSTLRARKRRRRCRPLL